MSITGERLRDLRKMNRKTLRDVWQEVGISWSNLAAIERGEQNCNASTLKILADYYNVSSDYLMGNTDDQSILNDIDKTFYEAHGLNDEQRKEVENFIAFLKSKEGK